MSLARKIRLALGAAALVLLALLLAGVWLWACAAFLGFIDPIPGVSLPAIVLVVFAAPFLLEKLRRDAVHGSGASDPVVRMSPFVDEAAAARVLQSALDDYRGFTWERLKERLFEEHSVTVSLSGGREQEVEVLIAPASYRFEGGNPEHFQRLTEQVESGESLRVTATAYFGAAGPRYFHRRARAFFEIDHGDRIGADASDALQSLASPE